MSLKETVLAIGGELGFHQVQIGSIAPMTQAADHYQQWLDNGYAADMEYLKRDPARRSDPAKTFEPAKSVIIVSVSYYSVPPPPPPGSYGRVARYAVGQDYHTVIRKKLGDFCALLEKEAGRPIAARSVTDDAALYEQALASRHGLGFVGKNSLVIGPKLSGSYNFIAELFVDLDLEPDLEYQGTCGNCVRCIAACPTNAIKDSAIKDVAITAGAAQMVDANLCISYLTIENKGGIPFALRSQMGDWVYGCDICQEVCPYNSKSPPAPWPEFAPASGAGHHLNLPQLLQIDSNEKFVKRFQKSPLRRPKRRGLLRNALVVMGNQLKQEHSCSSEIIDAIDKFAKVEVDQMLLEHSVWALAQSPSNSAKIVMADIIARLAVETRAQVEVYV